MNRRVHRVIALVTAVCAAVLVLAIVPWGRAQDDQQGPPFTGTPAEMEAYDLYTQNKLLSARTKAEEVLKQNPMSMPAHYVLGCVYREAEGSLARAMYHLGQAREIYEMRYGSMAAGGPWQLHRETLYAIQAAAGEMEEYEYQLSILDYYDSIYDPDLVAEHAWPLLHLGRYDEGRQWATRATSSSDEFQKSLGLNALCAIEAEARTREQQYQACIAALENARRRAAAADPNDPHSGAAVAVHAYNAALGAWAVMRHDEVERLATEATTRLEFTIANPWRILLRRHLDGGQMSKAIEAAREMHRWRGRQPANLRDQDRAETDVTIATLLLVAGEAETGLDAVDRAIERPDRRGLTSAKPEQALGAHALLRRALQRTLAEQTAERAAVSGTVQRIGGTFEAWGQRIGSWPDDERVASVVADDDRLESTLRLYVHGGIEPVPVWLVGDLVDVLGAGVVAVALRRVRETERLPALAPYYDALEAEVALAQGDQTRAEQLARNAFDRLPPAEQLLRARAAAVGAEAARQEGNDQAARALFEKAMQQDPGVIRRMGLSIPTRITALDGGPGGRVAELLERSPRFDDDDRGFRLATSSVGRAVRVTFASPSGGRMLEREWAPNPAVPAQPAREGQPAVEAVPAETDDDFAMRVADEVHAEIFAIRAGLSTVDLRSLDGSTVAGEQATREQMRGVLDDIVQQGRQGP